MDDENCEIRGMFTEEDITEITEAIHTILEEKGYSVQDKLFTEEDISDIAEAICVMLFDDMRIADNLHEDEQRYFTENTGVLMDVRRKIYKVNGKTTVISVNLTANGAICLELSLDLTPDHPNFPKNLRHSLHPVPPMTATALDAIVQKVVSLAQIGSE